VAAIAGELLALVITAYQRFWLFLSRQPSRGASLGLAIRGTKGLARFSFISLWDSSLRCPRPVQFCTQLLQPRHQPRTWANLAGRLEPISRLFQTVPLPILATALAARFEAKRGLIVPVQNAQEGAVVEGLDVMAVGSLAEGVCFYTEQLDLFPRHFRTLDRQFWA